MPEDFEICGTRTLQERGASVAVTIPPKALEETGLEAGDNVRVLATEEEVILTRWEESDIREALGSE